MLIDYPKGLEIEPCLTKLREVRDRLIDEGDCHGAAILSLMHARILELAGGGPDEE